MHTDAWEHCRIWFGQTHCRGYNALWSQVMRITSLLLNPLGPALILGVGGLLVALSRRVFVEPLPPADAATSAQFQIALRRARRALPLRVLAAILIALLALTLLILLRDDHGGRHDRRQAAHDQSPGPHFHHARGRTPVPIIRE